ncbi:MAG TPA: hypothetical protein VFR14_04210 [Candidatus Limnocylindrales bacterium]|nr:hypothetical protein [Candidatus Limnocylindrales bacterium]
MFGRTFLRVLLILIIGLGAVALGVGAYQAGLAAGLAADGSVVAPVPPYYGYGWHPFGYGFGVFSFIGLILFVLLFAAIVRAAAWGGHGPRGGGHAGWGGPGRWGGPRHHDHGAAWEGQVHDAFEDWHRQVHGRAGTAGPDPSERDLGEAEPGDPGATGQTRSPAGPSR